ncbi:hypothetical protein KUCAC02_025679, partial [Chaenocephalus aceratus]
YITPVIPERGGGSLVTQALNFSSAGLNCPKGSPVFQLSQPGKIITLAVPETEEVERGKNLKLSSAVRHSPEGHIEVRRVGQPAEQRTWEKRHGADQQRVSG